MNISIKKRKSTGDLGKPELINEIPHKRHEIHITVKKDNRPYY